MALNNPLRSQVESTVSACYHAAETILGRSFERPSLSFRRSGKNAGTAFLQQNRINFNPVLLEHNLDAYLKDVIPHEIAHLLVYQLYGRVKPHGEEWQAMMENVFKRPAKTTHNLDLGPLKLKTFDYECDCRTIALSARRHNSITQKKRTYICRDCNAPLRRTQTVQT